MVTEYSVREQLAGDTVRGSGQGEGGGGLHRQELPPVDSVYGGVQHCSRSLHDQGMLNCII